MSKVISITSSSHFKTVTSSSTYTVVDFYADWCGPCKSISPIFEQLANAESKPGRIVFAKVNVDNQRDVATTYGISAMPTFLILAGNRVKETVRGADPTALRSAVLSAAADAAKSTPKTSASFSSRGHTLGSSDAPARGAGPPRINPADWMPNFNRLLSSPAQFAQERGFLSTVVRFVGLYFTTLFSMEWHRAAAESPFAIQQSKARTAR